MAICLGWHLSFAFYKMPVSNASYKMKSFKLFLTAITRGKPRSLCADGQEFHRPAQNLTLFKEQVYQIYDFLQSTSDPEKWLEEHFLKGYEETDFDQVEGDLMESIQQALYEAESFLPFICPMKAKHLARPNIWKL